MRILDPNFERILDFYCAAGPEEPKLRFAFDRPIRLRPRLDPLCAEPLDLNIAHLSPRDIARMTRDQISILENQLQILERDLEDSKEKLRQEREANRRMIGRL